MFHYVSNVAVTSLFMIHSGQHCPQCSVKHQISGSNEHAIQYSLAAS